jgi:hypothetical protein
MKPQLVLALLARNSSDVKAIVETVGFGNLLSLSPHFEHITSTAESAPGDDMAKTLAVLSRDSADVKAVFDAIGIDNLLKIAPNLLAIGATIQAMQPKGT